MQNQDQHQEQHQEQCQEQRREQDRRYQEFAADMLEWLTENGKGRFVRPEDIMSYTGLCRTSVYKMLKNVPPAFGGSAYFYLDVARAVCDKEGEPRG